MPASPSWHLRGRNLNQPGLSEPELRHALLKLDKNRLAEYEIRHGRGVWNSADKVLDLFRLLARNGCYIRIGRRVEGPFTVTRAMQLVKEKLVDVRKHNPHEEMRVRVGRKSNWIQPHQFTSQYGESSRRAKEQPAVNVDSIASPELTDAAFESTSDFQAADDRAPATNTPKEQIEAAGPTTATSPVDAKSIAPSVATGPQEPLIESPPTPDVSAQSISEATSKPPAELGDNDTLVADHNAASHKSPPIKSSVKVEAETQAPPAIPSATDSRKPMRLPAPQPGRTKHRGGTASTVRSNANFRKYEMEPSGSRSRPQPTRWRRWPLTAIAICFVVAITAYSFTNLPHQDGRGTTLAVNWAEGSSSPEFEDPGTAKEPSVVTDGVPPGFLFKSRFQTSAGIAKGGVAFAARKNDSSDPVLVSVMRLLGPLGGLNQPIDALDLFTQLHAVDLQDCQSGLVRKNVSCKALIIPGAKAFPASSPHGDVFAFRPDKALPLTPLQVSDSKAWAGERVWIPTSQSKLSLRFHSATIVTNRDGRLVLEIEEPMEANHSVDGVIGAPVINSANEIIGVVSVSQTKNNRCRLLATPTIRFVDYL